MTSRKNSLSYKAAGVDIVEGDRLVERIKPLARSTHRPGVLAGLGSFGSLFRLDTRRFPRPVLVSGTDGVGTKLKVAFRAGRHDTVGIDLVAMCVNDILTLGAEPLFFLDYFATGRLSARAGAEVVSGIAAGCRDAGAALIGGETAEMPGFYAPGEYDLAGFSVGVVDAGRIVEGKGIRAGDVLIGLPSSGLHSNGYSLVRKVFFERKRFGPGRRLRELSGTLGDELLKPTRIYVRSVLPLLGRYEILGMAHITGGGLPGNIPRMLPPGLEARIDPSSWKRQPIFELIQRYGEIPEDEMYRTFNMGIGFVLACRPDVGKRILRSLRRKGEQAVRIGHVAKGRKGARFV